MLGGGTGDRFEVAAPIARHPTQKTLSIVVVPPEGTAPAAVEAALMGARGLVQSAIRDARVLRRKRKAEFKGL